jgi:hypothetical protein
MLPALKPTILKGIQEQLDCYASTRLTTRKRTLFLFYSDELRRVRHIEMNKKGGLRPLFINAHSLVMANAVSARTSAELPRRWRWAR